MLHVIFVLLSLSLSAQAADVVFVELDHEGRRVELEPGGRFFHVAIRYKGRWLQAHPDGGVSLVNDIKPFGHRFTFLTSADPEPAKDFVDNWLGKPFDYSYSWVNPKANYCSRLVAQALGVPPQPMDFSAEVWKNHYVRPQGEAGISPDKLFAELKRRGYRETCEHLL